MKRLGLLWGIVALLPLGLAAHDDVNVIARFDGGIAVQPVLIDPRTFVASANVVRGINPAVLPWTIHSLKAAVEATGELDARGRGLVLAGGPPVGTRGDISAVRALLFCDASLTAHVSEPAALDSDGDFKIVGFLTPPVGPTCDTPTLLIAIRPGPAFLWVAAGIPDNDD